jgi:hypothetical protein
MRYEDITGHGPLDEPPQIQIVAIRRGDEILALREGKWIDGRYDANIRIDRDTHFSDAGPEGVHAHVYGRKDRDNALLVVRRNGASSHGLKGTLHKDDADALRARGFDIGPDNIVEWIAIADATDLDMLIESIVAGRS